ncbi:MAG: hypothetical protein F6K16_36985, partial [Symploca sp. SIO2B6]|nr:hypothetical protein [Symploca sp. SIO2B6]
MALAVGALLQDSRYQVQAVLVSTDVDITYRANHTYLDRTVILKQLRDDVSWNNVDWNGTGSINTDWNDGSELVKSAPPSRALMAQITRLSQCQHSCLGKVLDCFEDNGQLYLK